MFENDGGGVRVMVEEADEFGSAVASMSDDADAGHE